MKDSTEIKESLAVLPFLQEFVQIQNALDLNSLSQTKSFE